MLIGLRRATYVLVENLSVSSGNGVNHYTQTPGLQAMADKEAR